MNNENEHINNELKDVDYSIRHLFQPKVILLIIFILVYSAISALEILKVWDQKIKQSVQSIPGCPIQFSDYHYEFFMPKIIINNISINQRCFRSQKNLNLSKLTINILGPSFSPFGVALRLKTNYQSNSINSKVVLGFSSLALLMESQKSDHSTSENIIDLSEISDFIPAVKLQGHIHIDHLFTEVSYGGLLNELRFNIASNDLKLPTQSINIFKVETIDIGSLLLQGELSDKKNLSLHKFTLGKEKSPIIANFSGSANLNQKMIAQSTLNIKGELGLSPEFQEKYAWTNFVFGKFDKKDKFYQIEVKGKIGSPQFNSPR